MPAGVSRRWARIHDLLLIYQGRPHGAWADADGDTLWSEVDWFYRRDRDGFAARVLEGLASEDSNERDRTTVLASHIDRYSVYRKGTAFTEPWLLPLPTDGAHRLLDFPIPENAWKETARKRSRPPGYWLLAPATPPPAPPCSGRRATRRGAR